MLLLWAKMIQGCLDHYVKWFVIVICKVFESYLLAPWMHFFQLISSVKTSWGLICVIAGAFFCRADELICNNTLCKLHTWVCDGKDDCGDNSDEDADMCGGFRVSLTRLSFEDSQYIFYKPLLYFSIFAIVNISLSFPSRLHAAFLFFSKTY